MYPTSDSRQISAARSCATALLVGVFAAAPVQASGTVAGIEILSTAVASFDIGGVPQAPMSSNSCQVFVDELLDAVLVNDDGAAVAVSSPQSGAIVQFTLTNTGNGRETFRLVADELVVGDVFDPAVVGIHLESNGVVGLQIGAGGDDAYVPGSNDPSLASDTSQIVYVASDIPATQAANADGLIALRAVANTIVVGAGTDDPDDVVFPMVAQAYVGQGDLDEYGGVNVTAVVGTSHDASNRLFLAQGSYRVTGALVQVNKTAITVLDPSGGATLVPGTLITYRIDVTVIGNADAENLVISDPIPADLEYQPGSLSVSALPAGEDDDDDFAPAGTDNTGFDGANQTITVHLDNVSGGDPVISMTFQTTIR